MMSKKKISETYTNALKNAGSQLDFFSSKFTNGLADAVGFGSGNMPTGWMGNMPFPGQGGFPGGFSIEQVSDSTTAFENLRWYYVSNFRQLISELYVEIGLIKTIVDVPVDDAFKGGIKLLTKQLSEDQVHELQISLDRDDDISAIKWAAKWDRLFGGAGCLILVDDQDPLEPLDVPAINRKTKLEFRACDMWELFWDKQNDEGYDPQIQAQNFQYYEYYSELIHKSRVMRFKGNIAPSFTRPFFRGWGVSVVEQLIRSINQFFKAVDVGFSIVDELKVDVYKMKNLANTLLSPEGASQVQNRIQLANWEKNYTNALVMDKEDEFDYKQLSFSGLGEYLEQARMQIAADLRMPIIKVFGTAVSHGFQTSEEEMDNYNSMVETEVRNKVKFDLIRMCEIKCQKLFGIVPTDLEIEFKPLRELSALDEENVKTLKYNRAADAFGKGILTPEKFVEIANQEHFFGIKIEPDDLISVQLSTPDSAAISGPDKGDPDTDLDVMDVGRNRGEMSDEVKHDLDTDPGADREDTRIMADINRPQAGPMMAPKAPLKKQKNPKDKDSQKLAPVKNETEAEEDGDQKIRDEEDIDQEVWAKAKEKCLKKYKKINWDLITKYYHELKGAE